MLLSTSPLPTALCEKTDYHNGLQTTSSRNSYAQHPLKSILAYNSKKKSPLSYQTTAAKQLKVVTTAGVHGTIANCITSSPKHDEHTNDAFIHKRNHYTKLIQPMDSYDDTTACGLPPPSPAPTTDNFVMGIPSPSPTSVTSTCSHNHFNSLERVTDVRLSNSQAIASQSPVCSMSNANLSSGNGNGTHQQFLSTAVANTAGLVLSQKFSSTNSGSTYRSLSPNSRFRLTDHFRENPSSVPDSTSRFTSNTHFISQNVPIVPENAYTYFSSTAHTPVKRYIPTPPLSTELYSEMPLATQQQPSSLPLCRVVSKNSSSHQQLSHLEQHQLSQCPTNVANILPYPFQMRFQCSTELPQQQPPLSHMQGHNNNSHNNNMAAFECYVSSPRIRFPYKLTSSGNVSTVAPNNCKIRDQSAVMVKHEQPFSNIPMQHSTPSAFSSNSSTTILCSSFNSSSAISSTTISSTGVICSRQENTLRTSKNCNDIISQTPGIEYIKSSLSTNGNGVTGRLMSPLSVFSSVDSVSNPGTGTCLHCNTMRRTTGVHQMTQTTGPISPVPLQHLTSNAICINTANTNIQQTSSSSTLSTSESHVLSLSPLATLQHQKKYQQQRNDLIKINAVPSKECYQYQLNIYQQQRQKQNRQLIGTQNNLLEHNNIINSQQQQYSENRIIHQSEHYHEQSPQQLPHLHQSLPLQQQLQLQHRNSRKQRISQYIRGEIAKFFGVEIQSESKEHAKWIGRQRRLALRRFGGLRPEREVSYNSGNNEDSGYINDGGNDVRSHRRIYSGQGGDHNYQHHTSDRPDILPAQDAENNDTQIGGCKSGNNRRLHYTNTDFQIGDHVERKASFPSILISGLVYIIQRLNKRQLRQRRQWSRSFAPAHIDILNGGLVVSPSDICEDLTTLQDDEIFFDSPTSEPNNMCDMAKTASATSISPANGVRYVVSANTKIIESQRQFYMAERALGWRTSAIIGNMHPEPLATSIQQQQLLAAFTAEQQPNHQLPQQQHLNDMRGNRIASQVLDGVLENSRRPQTNQVKLYSTKDLDDRLDHRPLFTYWINTVQILVLFLSLICYGIGPIGFGIEHKTGQVLVTSLSLQTVQFQEQRNIWIGPRNSDLVHMGAKFATCMRRDIKIIEVLKKTRRKERETACCIRNDDSGCVQSSQADCSVRGLFPTKSISTWKKWSPGESGPGGRISGSVCGLDPKYCDAPASIAPYEWPDDITKWPICRKTNSFSQRFRYKDYTAEHMVCEVIGHPCCTGVFGECRITTKEYCDFVNGYFHEEASLCSQISCLNNVCGMFPFFSIEVPDQLYRLLTSLCLHAGIIHLVITVTFQHIFLADLERLIGPIRTAIVYIGSGLAGNITSAVLVPYKPEVGPLASLSGVMASLGALLILIHWKQLYNPYIALLKLIFIGCLLFCIGTLPWQLNFAGLLAGIICGIFLTVALVPFVGFTKYARKAKINLIWSCGLFHLFIYSTMLIIFYIFPAELTNLKFGQVLSGDSNSQIDGIERFGNNVMTSSSNKNLQEEEKHQQFRSHLHSDDIISQSVLNDNTDDYQSGRIASNTAKNIANNNVPFFEGNTTNFNVNNNNSNKTSTDNYLVHNNELLSQENKKAKQQSFVKENEKS